MDQPVVLATHIGPLTATTLAVALETAGLSDLFVTHLVTPDGATPDVTRLVLALEAPPGGAGLAVTPIHGMRGIAAFALVHAPAGCKTYSIPLAAKRALRALMVRPG